MPPGSGSATNSTATYAEVVDGLSPGDAGILHPSDSIDEGAVVEARRL